MDTNENKEIIFEDISSSSPTATSPVKDVVRKTGKVAKKAAKKAKKAADGYGNSAFKNIDKIIKFIAFVVAIAFLLIFLLGATIVYLLDKSFILISALILLVGVAISLIFLFLIYGTGHIISQNKEILKKLDN